MKTVRLIASVQGHAKAQSIFDFYAGKDRNVKWTEPAHKNGNHKIGFDCEIGNPAADNGASMVQSTLRAVFNPNMKRVTVKPCRCSVCAKTEGNCHGR